TLDRTVLLIDGLLGFARSGAPPARETRADVHAVLRDLVDDLLPSAEEHHIALTLDDRDAPDVACSPGVLASVISNLVENALKHMGGGPVRRVTGRAEPTPAAVRLEVRDTGPGIPPSLQPHIFDPYVRAPWTDVPGLGLGLATVRRLAEAHGGSVGVESRE